MKRRIGWLAALLLAALLALTGCSELEGLLDEAAAPTGYLPAAEAVTEVPAEERTEAPVTELTDAPADEALTEDVINLFVLENMDYSSHSEEALAQIDANWEEILRTVNILKLEE